MLRGWTALHLLLNLLTLVLLPLGVCIGIAGISVTSTVLLRAVLLADLIVSNDFMAHLKYYVNYTFNSTIATTHLLF
jgi:hypothetical protein